MTESNQVSSLTASGPSGPSHAPAIGQQRVVIVGATGMVGGYALRYALDHPAVGTVTAIGRKKLDISHTKLREVLHQDFADCSALADALSGQDAAVFCLGVYTGVVSDAELRRITVDYTIEFARVLRGSSPEASFSFLSGNGADSTGRSRIPFARYKGEAENALLAAKFLQVFRCLVDRVQNVIGVFRAAEKSPDEFIGGIHSERINLQFRVDVFNTFNHTNFAAPDSGVGDSTIGQVFSTSVDQRRMQFGLRLHF